MMRKVLFFILILFSLWSPKTTFASALPKTNALQFLTNWDQELRENQSGTNSADLREKDLEIQFVNRLIFQVERKYQENDPAKFLRETIWDMYLTDKMAVNQSFGSQELFLSVLHQALEEVLEPQENALLFIKNFTRYSSIQDPAELEDFAATRNYFDGKTTMEVNPVDANTAAEFTEEKLKKIEFLQGYNLLESEQDLRNEFPSF